MFGEDEFTPCLMSVVFAVAMIPVVAPAARPCGDRVTGRGAAVITAVLFAISGTQIDATQEARPCALLTFGVAVVLAGAVAVVTAGSRAPLSRMDAQGPRDGGGLRGHCPSGVEP